MKVWVDADACPGLIKELIIRTARRLRISVVFVANKVISIPESAYVSTVRVGMGPEVVDAYIAQYAEACDFAVTQDIPLASVLVPKGVTVINPRGQIYTADNIQERLSIRNLMQDIREAGDLTPGPKQFGQKERQRFAEAFDRELTKCMRPKGH
jgi:uncharacterized protein